MHDHHAVPAIFSAACVTSILRAYGYDDLDDLEILPMPQGFGMALARVRWREHDIVIKQLNPGQLLDRVRFSLLYHAHLQAADIPCPRLHRTNDGHLHVSLDQGRFCLLDWCPGQHFDADPADQEARRHHRRTLGSLLGMVHAAATPELATTAPACCRIPPEELFTRLPPIDRGLPWSRGGPLMRRLWLLIHEHGAFGSELQEALPMLNECRARLISLPLAGNSQLTEVLPVHGDFHFENVLFDNGRVTGLIDFDNAAVSSRAFDIGSAMAVICQEREHEEDFLSAFEEKSGGARPDWDILRACVLLRLVNSLGFQIVAYTRRQVRSPQKTRWWIRRLIRLIAFELDSGC